MCSHPRRQFLGRLAVGGFALTPLAALLAGCSKSGWPEGMVEIKWDRDTCLVCSMVISDRRFAGQMRGGPDNTAFKFDDPGCVALWLNDKARDYPWLDEPATQLWIAEVTTSGNDVAWLDGRKAHYVSKTSPMGYNFAAYAQPQAGSLAFAEMRELLLQKGK